MKQLALQLRTLVSLLWGDVLCLFGKHDRKSVVVQIIPLEEKRDYFVLAADEGCVLDEEHGCYVISRTYCQRCLT